MTASKKKRSPVSKKKSATVRKKTSAAAEAARKRKTKRSAPSRRRTVPGDLKDVHPVKMPIFDRASVTAGTVTVHTRDIRARLIDFINSSASVLGCVAWVRDPDILAALAAKDNAAIIVQKETMLRNDANLRRRLKALSNNWRLSSMPEPLRLLGPDGSIAGCRCVGQHIGKANPGAPRMHHKFLVDVEFNPRGRTDATRWSPRRVWTGSFNFSRNADASLENAVEIADAGVAAAYFEEWMKVMAVSEPLDWTARMPKPQWKKM